MFCPTCGKENKDMDFCQACRTNLAVIERFLAREDSSTPRSRLISRTGLVAIFISEGFAWTLVALLIFILIIVLAKFFLPIGPKNMGDLVIATTAVVILVLFCGIPLLLGLVLLLKDLTYERTKPSSETGDLQKDLIQQEETKDTK
jgi:hypothetical protein